MEQIANREHQSNDSFHRDSPDAWRTALLVEGIIGALRQINHSQKRAACGLLLARIRPEQTTVIAATTQTPRGERSHAGGAHVAEGHKPYLKFIWRDVIFQRCRRCPFGQPREAPSPASPALGRSADRHSSGRLLASLIARNAPYPTA